MTVIQESRYKPIEGERDYARVKTYALTRAEIFGRYCKESKIRTSVIKKAEARLKQIKKITKDYSDDEIESLFTSLHTDKSWLRQWSQRGRSFLMRGMQKNIRGKIFRKEQQ